MKITKRQLKQIIKEEIEGLSINEDWWDKMAFHGRDLRDVIKGAVGMGKKEDPDAEMYRGVLWHDEQQIRKALAKGFPKPQEGEKDYWRRVLKAWNAGDLDEEEAHSLASVFDRDNYEKFLDLMPGSQGAKDLEAAKERERVRQYGASEEGQERKARDRARDEEREKRYFADRAEKHREWERLYRPGIGKPIHGDSPRYSNYDPLDENLERLKDIIREELEAIVKK